MKKLLKILIAVLMPLLMLAFIFMSVEALSGDRAWLKKEYEKLDINDYTGMSTEDQVRAFMQMVDFMKGKTDTMDVTVTVDGEETLMYNEREISHMHDVRRLYKTLVTAKWVVLGLSALTIALFFTLKKEQRPEILYFAAKAAIVAFCCILLFILAMVLWAAVDFYTFWEAFHVVFLDLESSTFDPAVSRMIRICPEKLFSDMVLRIFILAMAVDALIALGAVIYIKTAKKRARMQREATR